MTIYCPACLDNMIASHPGHTRRLDPPQVCKYWDYKAGKYICPSCLGKSPSARASKHKGHLRDHTCRRGLGGDARSRKARIEEGKPGGKNATGPARDPAVPPAGAPLREILSDISHTSGDSAGRSGQGGLTLAQLEPITIDDDPHQPLSTILGGPSIGQPQERDVKKERMGDSVSPKEERVSGGAAVPPASSKSDVIIEVSSDEGYIDEQAPESTRELRIAERGM